MSDGVGVQLSLAVTPGNTFGTAAWQFASAEAVVPAGQSTEGAVVSFTVSVLVQVAVFPPASLTVRVIVVSPSPTKLPAVGFCVLIKAPDAVQLSEATTVDVKSGTAAWQLALALTVCARAQVVMVGGVLSPTVTIATLELAELQGPLWTTARNWVVAVSVPVFNGLAVEAMSVQAKPSGDDCHFTMDPVWPLNVMVVEEPLQIVEAVAVAVPPTLGGLTVTARVLVTPTQLVLAVSVTVTLPLVVPKVTVIELLFGPVAPAVMLASLGTVHA
jgi:hypothetical protein